MPFYSYHYCMEIKKISYTSKTRVREVNIAEIVAGGDSSISFMSENNNNTKPLFALEIPYFTNRNHPKIINDYFGNDVSSFEQLFNRAESSDCDIICIYFEIEEKELETSLSGIFSEIQKISASSKKPLILKGAGNKNIDRVFLPKLAEAVKTPVTIAYAEESYYEELIPQVTKNNHSIVLRSPIDINLAKELNILSIDTGMDPDKILIDPDMGTLGYGLDYGYSIIEKIRQAAFDGDTMLNMPIITFVGQETFKAKEAKSEKFNSNWGNLSQRAIMWEVATTSAVISAGANIVVLYHPESITTMKELLWI